MVESRQNRDDDLMKVGYGIRGGNFEGNMAVVNKLKG